MIIQAGFLASIKVAPNLLTLQVEMLPWLSDYSTASKNVQLN